MFRFEFEATNDPRKGTPYVAKLRWDQGKKKVEREFFDLRRTWGKKTITVSGTYEAAAGDIIEVRTGGSWSNDYRDWYIVAPSGRQIRVANIAHSADKARVERYLRGELGMNDLLPAEERTETSEARDADRLAGNMAESLAVLDPQARAAVLAVAASPALCALVDAIAQALAAVDDRSAVLAAVERRLPAHDA